jgi:hypothetical protein
MERFIQEYLESSYICLGLGLVTAFNFALINNHDPDVHAISLFAMHAPIIKFNY